MMRLDRFIASAERVAFILLLLASVGGTANAEHAAARLQKVVAVNSLDQSGNAPFHLKIAFQVFSLEGKPFDTGLLEEWWASPAQSLITVTSSASKIIDPVPFSGPEILDSRERYLLRKLLQSELHPVPELPSSALSELQEAPKAFDRLTLTCLDFPSKTPIEGRALPLSFCVDQQTAAVRAQYEGKAASIIHNGLGVFHGTYVPVDLQVSFLKQTAITGKVIGLEVFDPSKSTVKLPEMSAGADPQLAGCTPGKLLTAANPVYPFSAKTSHVGGVVVLHGVLSTQGTIKDITTIATASDLLTQAAIDAYKQWTYGPCLVNGHPVEHEITVNITFNFTGSATSGVPSRPMP